MMIFGAPSRYIQGQGVLDRIGEELARLGPSAALVIDQTVKHELLPRIEASCIKAGVALTVLDFGGEASPEGIETLALQLGSVRPATIAAAGGGKCIDTGKALGGRVGSNVVTVPTIASNDSPTSHIYVLYDADHRLLSVEKLSCNPDLVLVDTDVIVRAPAQFLLAGIGDCIVKRFEVESCVAMSGRNVFGSKPSLAALAMAQASYDILRADAAGALKAAATGTVNNAFERIVEACVLMSGLSFENGGLCVAHAMTRGLSALRETAGALHGLQVAYGVTVQLVLEGRDAAFMDDHVAFYRSIGLPLTLKELGMSKASDGDLGTIASLTLAAPHMANFIRSIPQDEFVETLRAVELRFT
jgi:glycerol dehydrogenase